MTDLPVLTACFDGPDDEGRLAVLADWLEDHGDARAAVRRLFRWREAVRGARAEEVLDDGEDVVALARSTALALGEADARLWACAWLRVLPLLEGGDGPALPDDRRRRCVVAGAASCWTTAPAGSRLTTAARLLLFADLWDCHDQEVPLG
jgi:hypothetical protein